MYCQKCGFQVEDGKFCTNCGEPIPNQNTQNHPVTESAEDFQKSVPHPQEYSNMNTYANNAAPTENKDEAYKAAAKKYWYCYLFPILFFIPILKENKNVPGNKDVANNTLWILILGFAVNFMAGICSNTFIYYLLNICSWIVSIYAFVAFITACCGKAIRVPGLDQVKFFK